MNMTEMKFQSTLPARGATLWSTTRQAGGKISIHAPRTGSDHRGGRPHGTNAPISIHAPRTGSDAGCIRQNGGQKYFNPRSPHGERQGVFGSRRQCPRDFNPRSPHGERRTPPCPRRYRRRYFNPRSPHGERPSQGYATVLQQIFQSTLPARGATISKLSGSTKRRFQSTLPARGATGKEEKNDNAGKISIHAPRTGSDRTRQRRMKRMNNISIHAPRTGSDDDKGAIKDGDKLFQSTLPARGATWRARLKRPSPLFQSTLPARGATPDEFAPLA